MKKYAAALADQEREYKDISEKAEKMAEILAEILAEGKI
jgi:hypothetical protein